MSLATTIDSDKSMLEKLGHDWKVITGQFTTPDGNWDADSSGYEPLDLSAHFISGAPSIVLIEPAGGYVFEYDHVNKGVIAKYADYDAVADGALINVPVDSVDIDLTTRFIAIGK